MSVRIVIGDCRERLREMEAGSVHTCVTSPPYFGLRDYDHPDQIGLEATPDAFVAQLVDVFREVRRVLRDDGTAWLNLGDSYSSRPNGSIGKDGHLEGAYTGHSEFRRAHAKRKTGIAEGLKHKDLIGIPWRVAFALQADGWWLRQDIIWSKPNAMPESVEDRCTKAHEYLFLLSKSQHYYFDAAAIAEAAVGQNKHDLTGGRYAPPGQAPHTGSRKNSFARVSKDSAGEHGQKPQFRADREPIAYEGTRNKRSVWTIATQPFKEAHFATYPPALIEPCILAGAPAGGMVLDPFGGAGTTGLVADRLGRNATLIELNPEYAALADRRLRMGLAEMSSPPAPAVSGMPLFDEPAV